MLNAHKEEIKQEHVDTEIGGDINQTTPKRGMYICSCLRRLLSRVITADPFVRMSFIRGRPFIRST